MRDFEPTPDQTPPPPDALHRDTPDLRRLSDTTVHSQGHGDVPQQDGVVWGRGKVLEPGPKPRAVNEDNLRDWVQRNRRDSPIERWVNEYTRRQQETAAAPIDRKYKYVDRGSIHQNLGGTTLRDLDVEESATLGSADDPDSSEGAEERGEPKGVRRPILRLEEEDKTPEEPDAPVPGTGAGVDPPKKEPPTLPPPGAGEPEGEGGEPSEGSRDDDVAKPPTQRPILSLYFDDETPDVAEEPPEDFDAKEETARNALLEAGREAGAKIESVELSDEERARQRAEIMEKGIEEGLLNQETPEPPEGPDARHDASIPKRPGNPSPSEAFGEENTPLEPGSTFHFKDDELQEGPDPEYGDPERPEVAYAAAGTFVVGRRSEEGEGPEFNGSSEGCRIVTIWNEQTGEGALVHVGAEDIGTDMNEELIQTLTDTAPTLLEQGARAHVFGDVETSPLGEAAGEWNERLANHLRSLGIEEVDVVSEGRGKDVYLDTTTGSVKAYDATGRLIYPPEAPPAPQEPTNPTRRPDDPHDAAANQPPARPEYEFNVRQVVTTSDIVPSDERDLLDVRIRIQDVASEYNDAMMRRDAPTDPQEKAELLDNLIARREQGLDILSEMIQRNHTILDELRPTEGDDSVIRELLSKQLSSTIGKVDTAIERVRGVGYLASIRDSLQARKERLQDALARLNEPKSFDQEP